MTFYEVLTEAINDIMLHGFDTNRRARVPHTRTPHQHGDGKVLTGRLQSACDQGRANQ